MDLPVDVSSFLYASCQSSALGALALSIRRRIQLLQWPTESFMKSQWLSILMVATVWLCASLLNTISIWGKSNNVPCYLDSYAIGLHRTASAALSGAVLAATGYVFAQLLRHTVRIHQYERDQQERNLIRRGDFNEQPSRLPCPAKRHYFIQMAMRMRDLAIQDEAEERLRLEERQIHNTIVTLLAILLTLKVPLYIVTTVGLFHPFLDPQPFRMWTLAVIQLSSLIKPFVCVGMSKSFRQSVIHLFPFTQSLPCCKMTLQTPDVIRMNRI